MQQCPERPGTVEHQAEQQGRAALQDARRRKQPVCRLMLKDAASFRHIDNHHKYDIV